MDDFGRIAYAAYAKSLGGLTDDGRVLPEWTALSEHAKDAWRAAAEAIFYLCQPHQ